MKFIDDEGYNCAFEFVYLDNNERVYDSQLEKEFEAMLSNVVDLLGMQYDQQCSAYIMSEEQAQFLCGAAEGFCFAVNRRLNSGFCFTPFHEF